MARFEVVVVIFIVSTKRKTVTESFAQEVSDRTVNFALDLASI